MKKCETQISYKAHNEDGTPMTYPCGRTATKKVSYANEGESVSNQPICPIHLGVLQNKPFEIIVTDAT